VPDAWQRDLLRSAAKRALLLCSRQSGKSTVTAILALHTALYIAAALVVIVSPSQRQSAEMLRTIRALYTKLAGDDEKQFGKLDSESVLRVEFPNRALLPCLEPSARFADLRLRRL
jgi:phage terminase large subunit-like protein